MKEIADLLKQTRESKGKTLEEISSETKIQINTLRTLEDGDFSKVKNKAFLKGFIRQYARALHLNADEILQTYDRSTSSEPTPKPNPVSRLESHQLTEKTNVLWFRAPSQFITIGAIVIILFLITSIYFLSMKIVSYSQETFKEPTSESSGERPTAEDTPKLESLINTSTQNGVPLASPHPSKTEVVAPIKDVAPTLPPDKPKMVTLEANERVTIDAAWSTGKKETIKLSSNSRHVFYYAEKIKLVISDGGVVKINTHEKDLGIPGEAGKPVTINFN